MDQHHEQQQEVIEISSEEEEKKMETSLSSNEIREVCKMWETVQKFVEKLWQCERSICLTTMQCHISVKSSKGGKSKCH
jgi:hypothetical protein